MRIRASRASPPRYAASDARFDLRGWAMVAMSVRLFLILIACLAVAAVVFLIGTA